jgi:hypothetical protein
VAAPKPGSGGRLNGVAATSATNAWAIGVVGTGHSLILHWKKWSTVATPT